MSVTWNLWHGCHKISPGCANCYVYRMDAKYERDSAAVYKTKAFPLPVQKKRDGSYQIPSGTMVYTCFTSDFLLPEADKWRPEAWEMMRQRPDLHFLFITKRIARLSDCLPPGWGNGWEHVHIYCTAENQQMADYRLPIYRALPIAHKGIICEPLLGPIDLSAYLGNWAEELIAGGESGTQARVCDYDWVLSLREQCKNAGVPFHFKQTGACFKKDGHIYRIKRQFQHSQAKKANIDLIGNELERKKQDWR